MTTTKAGFSTTDPFDLPFGLTLKDAATDRGTSLQAGEYDVTAKCVKGLTQESFGTFTAAIFFTSPTAYNTGPVATSTSLAVSPVSPAVSGTVETLRATVAPAGAVGSVQFKDNGTDVGSSVAVSGGTASLTQTLAVGSHPLTAVFTPTDATAFSASTSSTVTYVVSPPAGPVATSTSLAVSPVSPAVSGMVETLRATVAPAGAVGSVQFKDNGTDVGSSVAVSGGTASLTQTLAVGSHPLTAVFTPTDATAFSASTSSTVTYVVSPPAGPVATVTSLTVSPASPVVQGTPVMVKATITATPATATVAGTVRFMDGSTAVGSPVSVAGGSASLTTSGLSVGSHSLTAVFTSTATNVSGSTSTMVTYVVNAPTGAKTTKTTLSVFPTPAFQGLPVVFLANVAPANAAGTVQFMDGTTKLGAPVPVFSGFALLITPLPKAAHSLTAVFAPTNSAAFAPSTSIPVPLTVRPLF